MQNVVNYMGQAIKGQGAMYASVGDARISHVDARDIGDVAARVLTEGGHEGKAYDLSGPAALTYGEMADTLSSVLGRTVRYVPLSDEDYKKGAVSAGIPEAYADALVNLSRNYRERDFSRVAPDVHKLLGRVATSFEQFARDYAGQLR
jgi:uncharacterized protein YbjT (DUF2867 family)